MFNKYKIKMKFLYMKQVCIRYFIKCKLIIQQIFIPLAIFQLIRTILFPTAFDVILLIFIFVIIIILLIEWI